MIMLYVASLWLYDAILPERLLCVVCKAGARCSSVVRPFAHGAMGQCYTTGVTKAVVCAILAVG